MACVIEHVPQLVGCAKYIEIDDDIESCNIL